MNQSNNVEVTSAEKLDVTIPQKAVSRSKCNTSCKVLPCLPNTTT